MTPEEYKLQAAQPRRRQHGERDIHIAVAEHLRLRATPGTWWSHFPAGLRRDAADARVLKRMGARAGVPDLLLLKDGRLFGLELKTDRGRLSLEQKACHDAMRAAGATISTANGIDEALAVLAGWNIIGGGR